MTNAHFDMQLSLGQAGLLLCLLCGCGCSVNGCGGIRTCSLGLNAKDVKRSVRMCVCVCVCVCERERERERERGEELGEGSELFSHPTSKYCVAPDKAVKHERVRASLGCCFFPPINSFLWGLGTMELLPSQFLSLATSPETG